MRFAAQLTAGPQLDTDALLATAKQCAAFLREQPQRFRGDLQAIRRRNAEKSTRESETVELYLRVVSNNQSLIGRLEERILTLQQASDSLHDLAAARLIGELGLTATILDRQMNGMQDGMGRIGFNGTNCSQAIEAFHPIQTAIAGLQPGHAPHLVK